MHSFVHVPRTEVGQVAVSLSGGPEGATRASVVRCLERARPAEAPIDVQAQADALLETLIRSRLVVSVDGRYLALAIGGHNHIDLEQEQLVWCDIGEHQLTEAFFGTFVARIAREPDDRLFFVTGLDALTLDYGFLDLLPPAGFVFHMGRCGSTLLSRALARSPQHVVLSEAQPHNTIWWCWTRTWLEGLRWTDERLKAYRNLLLLTGRRRCAEQRASFVKFSSWNVLLRPFIQQAFPEVPGVFLYRDPVEVMVSCLGCKPGWLLTKGSSFAAFAVAASAEATAAMTDLTFCEQYLARLLTSALAAPSGDLAYLDYRDLTLDNLGAILAAAFDFAAPPDQITLMREQFRRYSKDEADGTPFVRDVETKRDAVTPEIRARSDQALRRLYEALDASQRNLRPTP